MINYEHLNMLRSILDQDKFSALLDLYAKDSGRLIQECRDALQHEQWQHLSESAHGLKGSSANIGIVIISKLAKSLEQASKTMDRLTCLGIMGNLAEQQSKVLELLEKEKNTTLS